MCVCEVCFLGVVCAGALRVYACLRAYAHVRHRSRPSDNKRFLQPSVWVPSPDSAGTWSLPPSHLMPAGLVCTHEEKAACICKQTRTEMYTHWFDPAVPWQAWDLGLGCGVRGPQRVGKPDSNWVFFTGLDWVQSVTARVESCKKNKKQNTISLLKFQQSPILEKLISETKTSHYFPSLRSPSQQQPWSWSTLSYLPFVRLHLIGVLLDADHPASEPYLSFHSSAAQP